MASFRKKIMACLLLLAMMLNLGVSAPPPPHFLNDRSADIIGSSPLLVPDFVRPAGLSGAGQLISMADSGLDSGDLEDIHPDLLGRVVKLQSFSGRPVADDPTGHGTHMAAAIAGSGAASGGQYRGIAPGAELYFQALLDPDGKLVLPRHFNDLLAPAYAAGARIQVNGWGGVPNSYTERSAQVDFFVHRNPDFLTIFGSGNSGPETGTITAEANSKNALVVGSSQVPRPAFSPEGRYADQAAPSSSRGPAGDGRIKPELLAPGSVIISANSSLVESNFPANPYYNRQGGTSMAAAVTGGAAALLREYLVNAGDLPRPSSALMKALLVNGARTPEGFPSREEGFGILDLSGTVLALQEGRFFYDDSAPALGPGEIVEYSYTVGQDKAPLKATLAWVDPPAQAGKSPALVNNLDLEIETPAGTILYGNDFAGLGQADTLNNLEQVMVTKPETGEYRIRVIARQLELESSRQSFALVWGQPLEQATVSSQEGSLLFLDNGHILDQRERSVKQVRDGLVIPPEEEVLRGSAVYAGTDTVYIMGRTWSSGGVQVLDDQSEKLILEANSRARDGGYYLDPGLLEQENTFLPHVSLNGEPVRDMKDIPMGVEIRASIHPFGQSLWRLDAYYQQVGGYISELDPLNREITLFQDPQVYALAPWAAVAYRDEIVDTMPAEAPFGSSQTVSMERLFPGMKVNLTLSPATGQVQYIEVERQMAVGSVLDINPLQEVITLESGKRYQLFPGTMIYRDKEPVSLEGMEVGDQVTALLLAGSKDIIQLQANSRVSYGRVVFYSHSDKTLFFINEKNRFQSVKLDGETEVFRWKIALEPTSLQPGSWVRLALHPAEDRAFRIDVAELAREVEGRFWSYNPYNRSMLLDDGSRFIFTGTSLITKGGYLIEPDMILPGETVLATTLQSTGTVAEVLAQVEVKAPDAAASPVLEVKAYSFRGVLIVQGRTTADRVYLYREDGSRDLLDTGPGGNISQLYSLRPGEKDLKLVAIDSSTRGIYGLEVPIEAYPSPDETTEPDGGHLRDITGHPLEAEIRELAGRGVIQGFADGNFYPDQAISRVQFIYMLARSQDWDLESPGRINDYLDSHLIPWWATEAVYAAGSRGIIKGYPDGTLRPEEVLLRNELAVLLSRLGATADGVNKQAAGDRSSRVLPYWAEDAYAVLLERGWMPWLNLDRYPAAQPLTRGEAAAVISRLL